MFDGGTGTGETCSEAIVLPGTVTVSDTTVGRVSDYSFTSTANCVRVSTSTSAPDVAYVVTVPAGETLTASVTTPTWDATINLIAAPADNCGDAVDGGAGGTFACLASADNATMGTDFVQWTNGGATAQDVYIVIDGYSDMSSGRYTLETHLGLPPPGDDCSAPTAVTIASTGPTTLMNQTLTGFTNDYRSGSGCIFGGGPDRVYSMTVPPGLRLTARATSTQDLALNVIDDISLCTATPPQCSLSENSAGGTMSQTEVLLVDNTSTSPRPVLLVVDSIGGASSFTLEFSLGVPPSGDVCTSAQAVTLVDGGVVLPNETLTGFANDYTFTSGCEFGSGADRVYSVTVPANQRLLVRSTSSENLSLSAIESVVQCSAATITCLRAVDTVFTGMSQVETLSIENSTAMPKPVLIVVDSSSGAPSAFSLEFTAGVVPSGESCAAASPLMLTDGGVSAAAQSLATFSNDFIFDFTGTVDCAFGPEADRVYQVTVPAGQRLRAAASSTSDVTMSVVQSAAVCMVTPLVCVAAADSEGAGTTPTTERLMYDNTTASAQNLMLIVDSFSSGAVFDLDVTVNPLAYSVSTMSGMCDDLTMASPSVLLSAGTTPMLDDDVVSNVVALPFAFRSFRTPVTDFTVSSNGFMQLYTSDGGTPEVGVGNSRIPSAGDPEGVIAPFWDDLVPDSISRISTATIGTGTTRHFTVQWEAMRPIGVMGASLTFQARLYETTNIIELHACQLTPGSDPGDADREKGNEATVGIESPDGQDGIEFSYNQPALTTGQLIRFTPQ